MVLGFFVVLWFWQVRTGHNPIGEGESPAEFMLCGLWVLVPVAGLGQARPAPWGRRRVVGGNRRRRLAAAWWVINEI